MQSSFLLTVCQVGAEKALKEELGREHPDLRLGFSRPGFVTFKAPNGPLGEDFELKSVFARAYGLSLNKKAVGETDAERAAQVVEAAREIQKSEGKRLRLHVFERDQFEPGEEPKNYRPGQWTERARKSVLHAMGSEPPFLDGKTAQDSELVFDLICVEENEWWMGMHRHAGYHSPVPGGQWDIAIPDEAPSRAYLKLEEALAWSGAPVRQGDIAVEIGSAPGGASYALLNRGVSVLGIDPGAMDPRVLRFSRPGNPARFEHIDRPVATVPREELPRSVEWLLVDMNVEPRISLTAVDRLGTRMSDTLLGVILTLKLNQWSFAKEIPSWLDYVKAMGMSRVRATQLAHNRREICVYGLTRKGLSRLTFRS